MGKSNDLSRGGCLLTRLRKLGKGLDIAIICVRKRVMGVQRQEFPELPVNDPPGRTVGIFALDPKDGLVAIEWVQTIADADAKSVEKNGYPTVTFLVSLEPEFEHERCETASDEFIGDVHAMLGEDTGTSCLRSMRVALSDRGGK